MGNGYLGSPTVMTSTSNQEVVPLTPENWTKERYTFYKFSFINKNSCTVKINNGDSILLEDDQGFECGKDDPKIESFVIVESGIQFSWIGTY